MGGRVGRSRLGGDRDDSAGSGCAPPDAGSLRVTGAGSSKVRQLKGKQYHYYYYYQLLINMFGAFI